MLLGIDIFGLKKAIIDIFYSYIIFGFYGNISIKIKIIAKNNI